LILDFGFWILDFGFWILDFRTVGTIPLWSSEILSVWGREIEEEDLASGGRR
jgi:hypothetical protein